MSLPAIPASVPTVVPAMKFDSWWLSRFFVDGSNPAEVKVSIEFKKYATDADGNKIFSTMDPPVSLFIPDVLAMADPLSQTYNANVAAVVAVLLPNVYTYAQSLL